MQPPESTALMFYSAFTAMIKHNWCQRPTQALAAEKLSIISSVKLDGCVRACVRVLMH